MTKFVKHHVGVLVEKNAFTDEGDGVVSFPKGLVITDDSIQRNGTKYDIKTLDISEYQGQMTADHWDALDHIIAGVEGVQKVGKKVIVKKLNYLIDTNPLARLAYNLLLNPKVPTNFSIETFGPWPSDEDDTYYHAKLTGLSQVVVGNNRSATANAVIANSLAQAKKDGLDVSDLEKALEEGKQFFISADHKVEQKNTNDKEEEDMTFKTIKNSRDFAVKLKYKNAAGDEVETEVQPDGTVDVSEDQQKDVEAQVTDAEAPETPPAKKEDEEEDPDEGADAQANALAKAIENALKPVTEKFEKLEQKMFDGKAKEPQFRKEEDARKKAKNDLKDMPYKERHAKQINIMWDVLKRHDNSQLETLHHLNELHLKGLKDAGKVENSMTIADFGNFVISPELLTEIEGCRNDYTPLVDATNWKETLSTQMAWLKRQGDINMQEVEFCDDDDDGNLKPISEYSASIETANLHELAAVTPVCNAATRFLAADLLGDVAAGYRNDYDRKRAQLVIARLEQAVEENGNSVIFDTNPNVEALVALLNAWKEIANCTPNGTFVMNTSSYAVILAYALRAGVNGPLSAIFTTGDQPRMFGRPYIVVSDDLLPTLDSAGTKSIVVEGQTVTVNHAVFYANLNNFSGRTSGGLMYDLSTEAAYEDNGTVKSAYQRNELVLRGSFFRGGAIRDVDQVAGILSPGVS